MGISCSFPFSEDTDLESRKDSVLVRSIGYSADQVKTTTRSISFNSHDSTEPATVKSFAFGKMLVEGSVSFKKREMETMISVTTTLPSNQNELIVKSTRNRMNQVSQSKSFKAEESTLPAAVLEDSKNEAALKLQKVYKSFRTRGKLAD